MRLLLYLQDSNIDVVGVANSNEVKVKLPEVDEKDMKGFQKVKNIIECYSKNYSYLFNIIPICLIFVYDEKQERKNAE